MITDGEESCGGDVEAAIAALQDQGVEVVLNIIGFDLDTDDSEAARARFERWAKLGGGRYFDASSATELSDSLARATRLPYDVVNTEKETVASGVVGGKALTLPAGQYNVVVHSQEPMTFENIVINSGVQTEVKAER